MKFESIDCVVAASSALYFSIFSIIITLDALLEDVEFRSESSYISTSLDI